MAKDNVDIDAYKGRPRMDSTSGILLGIRLIKHAPKRRSARLRRALEGVHAGTVRAQLVAQQRSRLRPESLRPYDKQVDDGWGGLHSILTGHARLEGEPMAQLAKRLLALLFAEGTAFLTSSYETEWLHGETLLKRIDAEELVADIETVSGKHVLRYIRRAQKELGDALGVGDIELERASTTAMAEALDALAGAVAKYVRILAGETDEDDPKSLEQFVRAVGPLDIHRAYHARPRASSSKVEETEVTEDNDPNAPIPPIDPDPTTDPTGA